MNESTKLRINDGARVLAMPMRDVCLCLQKKKRFVGIVSQRSNEATGKAERQRENSEDDVLSGCDAGVN